MKKVLMIIGILCMAVAVSSPALAVPFQTLVQFDTDATATYDIFQIKTFDWADDQNLVIEGLITVDDGVSPYTTTLGTYFSGSTGKADGDIITLNLHAQAFLGEFSHLSGTPTYPSGYEVTLTLDATETATYKDTSGDTGGGDTLIFNTISGSFNYYLDAAQDADGEAGTGFHDVTTLIGNADEPFLTGDLTGFFAASFFTTPSSPGYDPAGVAYISSTITGYDEDVIDTDPTNSNVWLIGTRYDTTIRITTAMGSPLDYLAPIGQDQHQYDPLAGDINLWGDATARFYAVPEPATMLLLGSGLLGLATFGRKKKFKKN